MAPRTRSGSPSNPFMLTAAKRTVCMVDLSPAGVVTAEVRSYPSLPNGTVNGRQGVRILSGSQPARGAVGRIFNPSVSNPDGLKIRPTARYVTPARFSARTPGITAAGEGWRRAPGGIQSG